MIGFRFMIGVGAAGAAACLLALAFGSGAVPAGAFMRAGLAAVGLGGLGGVLAAVAQLMARIRTLESAAAQFTEERQATFRKYLGVLNTVPDGVAGFDPAGRLVFANESFRRFARELGIDLDRMMRIDVVAALHGLRSDGGSLLAPDESGVADFEIKIASDRWSKVSEKRSKALWSIIRVADMTAYKQAALTLEAALRNERETNAVYRNFISMVSHQFRTPLALIDSSAQRLIRRAGADTPDDVASRALKVRRAAKLLTGLVESTLKAARFDLTQVNVYPKPVNFSGLVREVCERHQDIAPQRVIRCEAPPSLTVQCDPVLIDEVLNNLVANALKYSPANQSVDVRCWAIGDMAFCSVQDQGVGIPAEDVPRLFERFFRASTAVGVPGTGIGLNFAHHVVQLHGGAIEVDTVEGRGSTFTIRLPVKGVVPPRKAARRTSGRSAASTAPAGSAAAARDLVEVDR